MILYYNKFDSLFQKETCQHKRNGKNSGIKVKKFEELRGIEM